MWTLVRFAFHTLTVCDVFNLNLSCPPKESQFVTWALRLRAAFSRGLVLHRAANNLSVNGPPLLPGENDVAPRGESKGPADVGVVADEAEESDEGARRQQREARKDHGVEPSRAKWTTIATAAIWNCGANSFSFSRPLC